MTDLQKVILSMFSDRQTINFATCDGLQPRIRPMTLIFKDDCFYIATSISDAKVKQILENPFSEFLYALHSENNSGYVRVSGVLKSIIEPLKRKEIADFSEYIYNYWASSDDPSFLLFEIIPTAVELMLPGENESQKTEWENN